jgi:acyl-CoA reductase-like NAD-dependent aldehyde dehydrogenase
MTRELARGGHWIGGVWQDAEPAAENRNPATGEVVGLIPDGGAEAAEAGIAAAHHAFRQEAWSRSPRLRAAALLEAADRLTAVKAELSELLRQETGKLAAVATIEIDAMASEFRYYAGLCRAIFGRTLEVEPGVTALLTREPAGVAAVMVPWNAPGILLARSLAPALAAGCTVVTKSAAQSSLFHQAVMQALSKVDALGGGVLNSFAECGSAGAEALVGSPRVDVLSFTGSTPVGKAIMRGAADTVKRLNLELGGKAAAIVLPDADPSAIAPQLLRAGLILSGQQCTALDRVLVPEGAYQQAIDALRLAVRTTKCGLPDDPATVLGPLIDRKARDRVHDLVQRTADRGLAPHVGRIPDGELAAGAFIEPSILAVDDLDDPIVQEEFFGPVVNIERYSSLSEAIEKANATRFGLAASVWSSDAAAARKVARELRAGTVWINDHNKLFPEAETGGFRESGFGRLHGAEGLSEFLSTKHIYEPYGTIDRLDAG